MKTLIFSDTHFSIKVDQARLDYILKLIDSVDKVIINGDLWDFYLCDFNAFINSGWQKLFPLLKSKNTIYLYGNHDLKETMDDRVNLYSDHQAYKYDLETKVGLIHIEHGDQVSPEFDYQHPALTKIMVKYMSWLAKSMSLILMTKFVQFKFLLPRHRQALKQMITFVQAQLKLPTNKYSFYVFGHCHLPFFSQEKKLCVTGGFLAGMANYLIIDDDKITHFHEAYE